MPDHIRILQLEARLQDLEKENEELAKLLAHYQTAGGAVRSSADRQVLPRTDPVLEARQGKATGRTR